MYYNTIFIKGNHEEKFIRWLSHNKNNPSLISKMEGIDEFEELAGKLNLEEINLIEKSILYFKLEKNNYLITHAGIPLLINELPKSSSEIDNYKSSEKRKYLKMLRIRYETPSGKPVILNERKSVDIFWPIDIMADLAL